MTSSASATHTPVDDTAASAGAGHPRLARLLAVARRRPVTDLLVGLGYLAFALWVMHGLWPEPERRMLALNPEDQTLIEWFLAVDARIWLGDFELVTDRLNAPEGINLLANATIIAIGAVLAPITLAFGAPTSFAVLSAGNLALTAFAWYLLYRRVLGAGRLAAVLGGAFCGFAPGMISQANSHPHMTAQWLVPLIVWCTVRMIQVADPEHPEGEDDWAYPMLRWSLALAGLVTVQVFVGEEVLFLTAVTLLLMGLAYAATQPALLRRVLPRLGLGLTLAVGLATALLAYPLWMQFAGEQSVPNGLFSPYYFSADLASFVAISPLSVAGTGAAAQLSTGAAEYNTFLGWPLPLVALVAVVVLRRRPLVIPLAFAALLMAWLSLGPQVVVERERTGIWAPYALIRGLPVIDGALPMRFALALIPLLATLLVLAVDEAMRAAPRSVRILVPATVIVALLPLLPAPLPTAQRPPLPEFISGGQWRDCVAPGGVLVPVPLPTPHRPDTMRWASATVAEIRLPEGFFIGPYGRNGRASMGTYKRPTSALLARVAETGEVPPVGPDQVAQARQDVAFWGASCVALVDGTPRGPQLQGVLERLFGPGQRRADALTWRVG